MAVGISIPRLRRNPNDSPNPRAPAEYQRLSAVLTCAMVSLCFSVPLPAVVLSIRAFVSGIPGTVAPAWRSVRLTRGPPAAHESTQRYSRTRMGMWCHRVVALRAMKATSPTTTHSQGCSKRWSGPLASRLRASHR